MGSSISDLKIKRQLSVSSSDSDVTKSRKEEISEKKKNEINDEEDTEDKENEEFEDISHKDEGGIVNPDVRLPV